MEGMEKVMPMKPALLLALVLAGCSAGHGIHKPIKEGEEVTISADELEPIGTFFLETRRVLAAEFIRIEMTPQFFEEKMGFTRDMRYVERRNHTLKDGTRVIELINANTGQVTNIDPDLLPRIYFGTGFEARAYNRMVIFLRSPKSRERPLFIEVKGKNSSGDAQLWVSGRLQHERPTLTIRSELLWSEDKERYKHRSSIG